MDANLGKANAMLSSLALRLGTAALRGTLALTFLLLAAGAVSGKPAKNGPEPVLLVVMDPLSKELACACVKGYGQRDYRKVAARLQRPRCARRI